MISKSGLSLCFIWFFVLLSAQQEEFKPVIFPENYTAQIDVIYKEADGWEGRIDLYTNKSSEKPTPIVLNIHGGGWYYGEKESYTGFGSFFKNGYAVANEAYRLVDFAPAPAAIEDVRCALIYLYNNAKELNIDTSKIVIIGGSAGGHLALMAGLLGDNTTYDADCTYDGNLKVAAIINKYGITDLKPLVKSKSVKNWLGKKIHDTDFISSVSPINYVTKKSPPIFIVHGDADSIVPYKQSVKLYKRLKNKKVKSLFLTIPKGKHGEFTNEENKLYSTMMWEFLKPII